MTIYIRALMETQPLIWSDDARHSIKVKCLFCSQMILVYLSIMFEMGETVRPDTCRECMEDFLVSVGEKSVEVSAVVYSTPRDKIIQNYRWRKYGFIVEDGKIVPANPL